MNAQEMIARFADGHSIKDLALEFCGDDADAGFLEWLIRGYLIAMNAVTEASLREDDDDSAD